MRGYLQDNLLLRNNDCIHAFVVEYHTKGRGLCTQSSTTISGRTLGFHTGDLFWRQCQDGLMPVGRHLGGQKTMSVCVRCCEGCLCIVSFIYIYGRHRAGTCTCTCTCTCIRCPVCRDNSDLHLHLHLHLRIGIFFLIPISASVPSHRSLPHWHAARPPWQENSILWPGADALAE
jgi:hypothetical protein